MIQRTRARRSPGRRAPRTLRAKGAIRNIAIKAYPMVGGIPYDQLGAHNLNAVAAGATWDYATNMVNAPFTDFMQFATYIPGATSYPFSPKPNGSFAPEARIRELDAEREARAALHASRVGIDAPR